MRKKLLYGFIGLMIGFVLMPAETLACSCVQIGGPTSISDMVTGALRDSNAVFSGKVIRFEYRKGIPPRSYLKLEPGIDWETKVAVFAVDRWWKMPASNEVVLVTDEMRSSNGNSVGSSCDYYFDLNETYLVFASGSESELRTHACSSTRPLASFSSDFLDVLGRGNLPVKKFEPEKRKVSSLLLSALPFELKAGSS